MQGQISNEGFQQIEEAPVFKSDAEKKYYQAYYQQLPQNFNDFLQHKRQAFNLFSKQKEVVNSGRIQQQDANQFELATKSRATMQIASVFTTGVSMYYLQKGLRFRNVIYGLTYRFTIFGLFLKYYLVPQFVASTLDGLFFQRSERSVQQPIMDKYDFNDEYFKNLYYRLKETQGYTLVQPNQQVQQFQQQQQLQQQQQINAQNQGFDYRNNSNNNNFDMNNNNNNRDNNEYYNGNQMQQQQQMNQDQGYGNFGNNGSNNYDQQQSYQSYDQQRPQYDNLNSDQKKRESEYYKAFRN